MNNFGKYHNCGWYDKPARPEHWNCRSDIGKQINPRDLVDNYDDFVEKENIERKRQELNRLWRK